MTKMRISITSIASALTADAVLASGFGESCRSAQRHHTRMSPYQTVAAAIQEALDAATQPAGYAERVRDVIQAAGNGRDLLVDLGAVNALKALCGKLYRESYRPGYQPAMASFGLDDPEAAIAGEQLLPLLKAIQAVVRTQSRALKLKRAA